MLGDFGGIKLAVESGFFRRELMQAGAGFEGRAGIRCAQSTSQVLTLAYRFGVCNERMGSGSEHSDKRNAETNHSDRHDSHESAHENGNPSMDVHC